MLLGRRKRFAARDQRSKCRRRIVMLIWTDSLRRLAREIIPRAVYHRLARWYGERVSARVIGPEEYRRLKHVEAAWPGGEPEEFRIPGLAAPVYVRPGTTDAAVFQDNLLRRIYGCYEPAAPVQYHSGCRGERWLRKRLFS